MWVWPKSSETEWGYKDNLFNDVSIPSVSQGTLAAMCLPVFVCHAICCLVFVCNAMCFLVFVLNSTPTCLLPLPGFSRHCLTHLFCLINLFVSLIDLSCPLFAFSQWSVFPSAIQVQSVFCSLAERNHKSGEEHRVLFKSVNARNIYLPLFWGYSACVG